MTTPVSPHAPFARTVGAILGLTALLAAMVVTASPAHAHARLESSSPADGATLTAAPPEIMLKFNEPIKEDLNQVSVESGSTDVTDGEVEIDGNTVYQPVSYSMDPGEYTVKYKVVSADGHPVSGTVSFTYDPPEGDTGAGDEPGATEPSTTGSETSGAETSGSKGSSSESADGPSSTSPGTAATADDADDTSGSDGVSPWWWAAGAGALVIVLGGIGLLARGRRH